LESHSEERHEAGAVLVVRAPGSVFPPRNNEQLRAAKVRNGFVPQVRRDVATKFKGLEVDTCPFANLPEMEGTQWLLTKEEMKNCVRLKLELILQIEFTERTPDGHLRHSKVCRV
jgi:bifunctional non-homologous end joining protein LigD